MSFLISRQEERAESALVDVEPLGLDDDGGDLVVAVGDRQVQPRRPQVLLPLDPVDAAPPSISNDRFSFG